MTFQVKIISPIHIDAADLARREQRYGEVAGPGLEIQVANLLEGPPALNDADDLAHSEQSIYVEGMKAAQEGYDAILIDCVFDPALRQLQAEAGLPVFGPMETTLSILPLIASSFAVIARSEEQCQLMEKLIKSYQVSSGSANRLVSVRSLGLTYPQARQADLFTQAMAQQVRESLQIDGVEAIVMGSTTMALSDEICEAAGKVPLVLPGLLTLRVIDGLWREQLLMAK